MKYLIKYHFTDGRNEYHQHSDIIEANTIVMTNTEKLKLYHRFREGCELEDAVGCLITAADILNGFGDDAVDNIILIIEKLIGDHVDWLMYQEDNQETYDEFDEKLFKRFSGGLDKRNYGLSSRRLT